MSDDKHAKNAGGITTLLKVLSKHYNILVSTGSDQAFLKNYSALLKFLRSAKREDINHIFFRPTALVQKLAQSEPKFTDSDIANFSIEELEKLLNDNATPRKFLERIAIHRFKVPQGSMRSFSNRRMLVEKLATLIRNEQAHATIDTVARS